MKKTVIITGANRGLGEGLVDVLMRQEDCFIISISRSLSEEQKSYPSRRFFFLEIDLSDNKLTEKLIILKKKIETNSIYFINNASIIEPIAKIEDLAETEIDRTLAVNIKASVLLVKFFLNHFNSKVMTFVNISSGAAKRPIANWSLYCSSKAFMEMFLSVTESEYPHHRFFNINPGVMDTGMQKSIRETDFPDSSNFKNLKEEGKLKSPTEVAREILETVL